MANKIKRIRGGEEDRILSGEGFFTHSFVYLLLYKLFRREDING